MTGIQSSIVSVMNAGGTAAVQAMFSTLVADWRASGARIVGVIAESHGLPGRACAAGVLRDIVSAKAFPIYLEQAPSDTSCHLDATGVDAACAEILRQLAASDLVVLSKFGKLEAAGSGLTPAFEAAIAAGKPVLTSVSDKHVDAWRAFAPAADCLPADTAALQAWWHRQKAGRLAAPGTTR